MAGHVVYRGTARTIVWATDSSGKMRGREYFEGLDQRDRAKFDAKFSRMGDMGTIRNPEHFAPEGDGIYVFKIFKHRLFCFFDGIEVVITHGFKKKSNKMPRTELERAKRIRSEHMKGGQQ